MPLSTSTMARDRLILAVDTSDINEARRYLDELHAHVGIFKIGLQLFTHYGPEILKIFQSTDAKIFLDCKFLDIPNTVAKAAEAATMHGIEMFTIHACGGTEMLKATSAAVSACAQKLNVPPPTILAVTVLTSISPETLRNELSVSLDMKEQVIKLARQCKESGITGLVASPEEVSALRAEIGKEMVIVTPGVRPNWADSNDQKRFTTPAQAIKNGSDYLVVGRPITSAKDPRAAAQRIVEEMQEALEL
ncbi:MAG: orotidine-5'-phosphate decarboxylase [Candidatus Obscuribacterales bacterium]|nr:orotidine-5'-phosphate decarboxylase [Candidatus Obscuribacterales bacterium]